MGDIIGINEVNVQLTKNYSEIAVASVAFF